MNNLLNYFLLACLFTMGMADKVLATVSQSSPLPGKMMVWGSSPLSNSKVVTRCSESTAAAETVSSKAQNLEAVVLFTKDSSSPMPCNKYDSLMNSYDQAKFKFTHMNIFPNSEDARSTLQQTIEKQFQAHEIKDMSLNQLMDNKDILSNNKLDVIRVQMTPDNMQESTMQQLMQSTKVAFVMVDEPDRDVRVPRQLGEYSRVLTTSSDVSDGIYYKPEGAEYSIYYADTYLYITPDIFTGIMTGLFLFFTLAVGLSCLNDVQGIVNFYDKLPVVGKEA